MVWEPFTTFNVFHEWQVSPPVLGEIFRVRHTTLLTGRGLIGQALLDDGQISIFDVRDTYVNVEHEIFLFIPFIGMVDRRIAIRSVVQYSEPWTMAIDCLI